MTEIVIRPVITQCQQVLAGSAPICGELACIERRLVDVLGDRQRPRENDQLSLTRRQAAAMVEKSEREFRRELKVLDDQSPAMCECVFRFRFDSLFRARSEEHTSEL